MDDSRRDWHIEKSVSVGHMVTTLSVAVGVIWYLSGIEGQIAQTRVEQDHIKRDVVRIEEKVNTQNREITDKLEKMRVEQKSDNQRIESKIDKLIDRALSSR